MSEYTIGATWLHTTLSGDATLAGLVGTRIYDTIAPQNASVPLVVFQHQGSRDVRGATQATRVGTTGLWLVKAIAQGQSFAPLETIEARIDALLHAASGSAASGTVIACTREAPFTLKEEVDGVFFTHLGGLYRLFIQR